MRTPRLILIILSVVVTPIAALAIWAYPSGNNTSAGEVGASGAIVQGGYSASWAAGYDSIAAMASASDLVVIGRIVSRQQVTNEKILFTDFVVDITKILKGDGPSLLVVMQTGGIDAKGRLVEMNDDPLFDDKSTYLLFLSKDPNTPKYYVVGGPSGRFVVSGSEIRALSLVYPERKIIDTGIQKMSLEAATREVMGR